MAFLSSTLPRKRFAGNTLAAAVLALPLIAPSQTAFGQAAPTPVDPATPSPQPQPGRINRSQAPGDFTPFEQVIEGLELVAPNGLMPIYRAKAGDMTKDQTRLITVVPRGLIGQDFLVATSITRGNLAGWQWVDGLVRWEIVGKQLMLVAPDTRFINRQGQSINVAVDRTYRPTYLFALPIVSLTPQGDPVIDLGSALFSPTVETPGLDGSKVLRRDLSRVQSVKAFPDNILIDVDLALADRASPGGTSVGISYSFRRLPDLQAFKPRVADERIGYFTTVRQDWSQKYTERETVERYVNRWDLKKKDPSLDLSPPEKPITFVLDSAIPLQWRKYVAEGILEWNKAFEKVGIDGAIVVQQQTDDNEFAGADPADARYNFVLWTVRGVGLAVGPSRADPRTGQIMDADIVVDDGWIRAFNDQTEVFSPKSLAGSIGPDTLEFWSKNPSFLPPGMTVDHVKAAQMEMSGATELLVDAAKAFPASQGYNAHARQQCNFAIGLSQQLAVAQMLVEQTSQASGPVKVPDSVIGFALKEVIAHEVGHTLGLRHNFKASAWLSIDEIRKRRDAGEPYIASVMDYTPMVFFKGDDLAKTKSFASDAIGPYDYWAISYGYTPPSQQEPEAAMLKKIAAKGTQPELAYATDEDTTGLISPDPLVNRYDMSDNPTAWAKTRIELADSLLANIKTWAVKKDDPQYYLRTTFQQLMAEKSRAWTYVSRQVGGQYFTRNRPSDPNAKTPFILVDAKTQREALKSLNESIFKPDFYAVDPNLLNELAPSRWSDWASEPATRLDFPYYDFVQRLYSTTLFNVCSPTILQRVYDAEVKSSEKDKFTAAELITGVRDSVWSELKADQKENTATDPRISAIRRGMQNTHLNYLLASAESQPGQVMSADLRNMVRFALRELSAEIGTQLTNDKPGEISGLDFATRAHLFEAKSRIDRTLDKQIVDVQLGLSAPTGGDRGATKNVNAE